ncbi:MAG: hypothetical protein L6R39_001207 [Caloplaca ligustica]|nr:MAG: hypothetical protein L6R39_001207 [Caloplaca ligustica]
MQYLTILTATLALAAGTSAGQFSLHQKNTDTRAGCDLKIENVCGCSKTLSVNDIKTCDKLPNVRIHGDVCGGKFQINARSPQHTVRFEKGSASLPSPAPGLTLKAITLGRGTQNYTCATGSTAAPVAVGAKADLLDATPLLPLFPSSKSQPVLNLLPEYLVSFNFATIHNSTIPVLGHHFFDAAGVPIFDLGKTGLLKAKKIANIAAPASACKGSDGKGDGAVDWLALTDAGGSIGLKEVYRVETAGGKAPKSCGGGAAHNVNVQYAAQYWFFG